MNGVFIDSEGVHAETIRQVLAEEGVAFRDADRGEFCGVTDQQMFTVLRGRYGLRASVADLVVRRAALLATRLAERSSVVRGAAGVVRELHHRGYRPGLASSADQRLITRVLDGIDASLFFAAVVSGREMRRAEPAPDAFVEAARRPSVPPDACLVVEDSKNGLLAAQAAGLRCVIVPCRQTQNQDFSGAEAVMDQLSGLLALLP